MKTELTLQDRTLTLFRYPKRANETLQAWDAGDEYLINHLTEMNLEEGKNILILNDSFGALSCWFSQNHNVTMMSDSFIAHKAALKNLQRNRCQKVSFLNCLDDIPDNIDLVLMQLPKSNRLLTWQLSQLRRSLTEDCPVIAVNKAKEIHTSTLNLFEKYLGETKTSLAWKKHRLVFSQPNCETVLPVEAECQWQVEGENITLSNYANVYSGESLDLGSRFMLQHIPTDPELRHIIDLGCGNGVLSIKAGQLNPQARITSIDESFMAVASAKKNLEQNLGTERNIQVIANNCLDGMKENSTYLVLCNPPFHQNNTITDHIAWQMFCDAKDALNHDGKLLVVGNRHLEYPQKLARLFGREQVTIVAENNKFVIIEAIKNNDLKKRT
ncbi:MAG: methyltransferase [Vibrio sp.]